MNFIHVTISFLLHHISHHIPNAEEHYCRVAVEIYVLIFCSRLSAASNVYENIKEDVLG